MATPLPPSLKPIVPFTKQASQLEKYDSIMSYYCMLTSPVPPFHVIHHNHKTPAHIEWKTSAKYLHHLIKLNYPGKVYATQMGIGLMGTDPAAKKYIIGLLTQCEAVC